MESKTAQISGPLSRDRDAICSLIAERVGLDQVPEKFKVITDTSDFFRVEYNDVVILGETPFWVKRYEKEGRFGLDDEPKFWVRRAIDLTDGSTRILKLVFHEEFETKVGGIVIKCFRSPKKEARILDLVAQHKNFMHGYWVMDTADNNVRVLEYIRGARYEQIITEMGSDHHDYFYNHFSDVLDTLVEMAMAIKFLHDHGEKKQHHRP